VRYGVCANEVVVVVVGVISKFLISKKFTSGIQIVGLKI
jgi:hypothetical protein